MRRDDVRSVLSIFSTNRIRSMLPGDHSRKRAVNRRLKPLSVLNKLVRVLTHTSYIVVDLPEVTGLLIAELSVRVTLDALQELSL